MVYTNNNSIFPDQVVPESEKKSLEYGLAVGNAIEQEWFRNNSGQNRFCLLYTSPSPRDRQKSRMPSSA